jgi:hypothetical protein
MDEDETFLNVRTPGFKEADQALRNSGWREKKYSRATSKDIENAYRIYLRKERIRGLKQLSPAELDELDKEINKTIGTLYNNSKVLQLRMYTKQRIAAAMNDYNEEELFIPENERVVMSKRMRNAERRAEQRVEHPKSVIQPRNAAWASYREPPKARFPNVALNLPNNSDENYKNAMPLNNILRNLNRLNIGNRNRNRNTRKRKRSLSLNGQRKSHKRSRYMNAPSIRRFKRRGSKFSNLPRSTRKKYMRRLSRINRN